MPTTYPFTQIEHKWQKIWDSTKLFAVTEDPNVPVEKRMYVLDMFPYPSGQGLHVGHPEGYTATDIYTRYLKANGYNVLHPMGFDSFGLPAENYAIKTGTHPHATTTTNIATFKRQIKSLGFCYDWQREVATHEPDYYRWTQWLFVQIFKKGLVYEDLAPINWCDSCKTGLANEEVTHNHTCDRCGMVVTRKPLRQWKMRITQYADRLLEDLNDLDWPEAVKSMQRNWIGKSEGAQVTFNVTDHEHTIAIYTTRPDTIYGVTYMVLAPEHPLVEIITPHTYKEAVHAYCLAATSKSELERTALSKEKTGVFSGAYAMHPLTGEKLPIWLSDYVMMDYGTGAIMAVPAHDERDFAFAMHFSLPIKQVLSSDGITITDPLTMAYTHDGVAINSEQLNGLPTKEAKAKAIKLLTEKGIGEKKINYKLRDWLFSRQRYWGEPIPIIHCSHCGLVSVPEDQLPLLLPEVDSYQPTGTGDSPLAAVAEWVNTICPKCGREAKRETNTMPQWAGSCWYYLRYMDPHNTSAFVDPAKEAYWMPVGLYIGGMEHAVLHLLYARFWHKIFYDLGLVSTKEPFQRLINQGMILGENNEKMAKSRGNVVNPDEMVERFGADTLRLYEMFMGPLQITKPWHTSGMIGVHRFLIKVYDYGQLTMNDDTPPSALMKSLHKTIKKVSEDTNALEFNTAIAAMMIFMNDITKHPVTAYRSLWIPFLGLLAPYAPHLAEELYQKLGFSQSIILRSWPIYDAELIKDSEVTIAVQINGKMRDTMTISTNSTVKEMEKSARILPKIQEQLVGKEVIKVIAVPGKIVNIVVN
jgi:leucyl-tRNA synthetase